MREKRQKKNDKSKEGKKIVNNNNKRAQKKNHPSLYIISSSLLLSHPFILLSFITPSSLSLLHSSFSGLSLPLPYPSHPFILLCIIPYLSHYSFSRPQAQQRSERPQSAQSYLGNCRRPLPRSAGYYGRLQRGGGCQQYPPASTIPLAL